MKLLAPAALSVLLFANGLPAFGLMDYDLKFLAQGTITFDKGTDKTTLVSDTSRRIFVAASLGGRTLRLFVDTGFLFLHLHQNIIDENPASFTNAPRSSFRNSRLVKSLRLGSVTLDGVPVVESPDFETIEDRLQVDGTIGMAVLSRLNWQFDQTTKTMTIFKDPQPLKDPVDINPFYDLRLVVDGTIDGSRASWVIDTGWYWGYPVSGLQKAFLPASTNMHSLTGTMWRFNYMQDESKDPTVGVFRNVVVGPTSFQAMSFFLFWPKDEYSHDFSGFFNNTGILSQEFFEGGILQVNGPDGQVAWILPKRGSPPTEHPAEVYGIELQFVSDDRWSIIGIDEQSWAYKNGLRLGDVVLGSVLIDGKLVLSTDSEILRNNPHAVVGFNYERDGVVHHLEAPYADTMRDVLFQN